MSSFEQLTQGWCVQYAVACARLTPCSAPWTTALASAWVARRQCSLTSLHPTSVQCATPRGAPLYPVVRIRCSRASTQPTEARGQVARVPTVCAICMKYSSQPGRIARFFRSAGLYAFRSVLQRRQGRHVAATNLSYYGARLL